MKDAISHPVISVLEPDWFAIGLLSAERAAEALKSILSALDNAEEQIEGMRDRLFNRRMCCLRIYRTRELWKLDIDPKSDKPFTSMDAWIEAMFPTGTSRYAKESAETEKALGAVPIAILAETPRCNARMLASKYVSDECRRDPAIQKAMVDSSEKGFREKLNKDHGQHIEATETLKFTYPAGDASQVKRYLDWVIGKAELEEGDYAGALLYLAIHENGEHE
jgi:hypothetical protein